MKELTIFTPTYNRSYTLDRAYKSLLSQTNKNFIWTIIDDGSSDDTEKKVKSWIKDNIIEIEYYKKENGGKHSAYNYFLKVVKTKYVLISLDSDDYLVKDAIETIYKDLDKNSNKIGGITYLCDSKNMDNAYVYNYKINKLTNKSFSYALSNELFNCGAVFVFEYKKICSICFPIYLQEKFFTEAFLYFQYEFPMLWTKKVICVREFIEDGLTKNTNKLFLKYPNSWYDYNILRVKRVNNPISKVKYLLFCDIFGILAKRKFIKDSSYPIISILLYPIALFGIYIIKKRK